MESQYHEIKGNENQHRALRKQTNARQLRRFDQIPPCDSARVPL